MSKFSGRFGFPISQAGSAELQIPSSLLVNNCACKYEQGLLMPAKIMSDPVIFSAQFQKRFVSGHDFSRAAKVANDEGFSPCGSFFRLDSASGPARQCNRPGDTTFAGTNKALIVDNRYGPIKVGP